MAVYAIGDVQGCFEELEALLGSLPYSAVRDRLWFVGDLVNRGPQSLEVLRFVRALGDKSVVVLGNHDLHLVARALGSARARDDDTLDAVTLTVAFVTVTVPPTCGNPARASKVASSSLPVAWACALALYTRASSSVMPVGSLPAASSSMMAGDSPALRASFSCMYHSCWHDHRLAV